MILRFTERGATFSNIWGVSGATTAGTEAPSFWMEKIFWDY
jgi:hypothetical protein